MKSCWLVLVLACLAAAPPAVAGVVGTEPQVSGALTLNTWGWSQLDPVLYPDTYALDINETVHGVPASVLGGITADGDPMVWIRKSVENDTSFAWVGYNIDIRMPVYFDILQVTDPTTWTHLEPTPAVLLPSGKWQASISWLAGTPIPIGQFGDFGILVSFTGTVDYCVDQTPVAPEPVSLLLLAIGGSLLGRRRSEATAAIDR